MDNVLPRVGGVRKPWYYFLTRDYWCPHSRVEQVNAVEENNMEAMLTPEDHEVPFEDITHDLKSQKNSGECFTIEKMSKKFDDGKVAVKNFTLELYKNQVFILLGHNGAGKTTVLSMLAGLLVPTSGRAFIKGINVFKEQSKLKEIIGICPQEDILYETLTVEEHLNIFSSFKDVSYEFQREKLIAKMKSLGFLDCFNKPIAQLSGGQRRKLSVLLSLIGDSSMIMLDEPTSGLDVDTRRKIWKVIKEIKEDRIILMTTHYMDEAEELGDRIGIMSDGEIKCCGSALFLKKQFKTGYDLTMVKSLVFDPQRAGDLLSKYVHNYQVSQNSVSEIIYNIPFEASHKFPQMFKELDESLERIGMSSYGMAITSLNDVFLKVGEYQKKQANEEEDVYSISKNSKRSFYRNIRAVSIKIWLQALRNPRIIILEVLLPLILFGFSLFGTAFNITTEYTYTPEFISKRLPVVINNAMGMHHKDDNLSLEKLKKNIPYQLFNFDYVPNSTKAYERAKDVYTKGFEAFEDKEHFGMYYIDNITSNNFTAMITADPKWTLMPSYLASILTNAYIKTYNPKVNVIQKVAAMSVYDVSINFNTYCMQMIIFIVLTGIAFSIPIASIAYFLVKERKMEQKFIEIFHGLNLYEYWIGRFIADYVKLLIPFFMVIIIKFIMGLDVYSLIIISCLIMSL